MHIELYEFKIITQGRTQLINLMDQLNECVEKSGIKDGFVHIMSKHTTVSVVMNEGFPCVEEDILRHMEKLAPDNGDYIHNHYLPSDGCIAYNAPAHMKSILMGYFAYAPIQDGKLKLGSRMEFYLAELDGPKTRGYVIQVCGNK
ncbi:secondary thiamine-phosphate synthase enzyme YjbQ [Breznakiella homolactica]|uniref:YjbQ family protein n=1 Tax=Breznakiella homolactica TaxID=2798577 RepID=A0A7T8BBV4_9SPIR|nr:secondary thiamine-phosphate synthase enzyme YjbQ [Breznakiella homolactica]QQO10776.1 secondary thiamine-phosphate synthase enzyme YjbQ [Breznakiella homolactica]